MDYTQLMEETYILISEIKKDKDYLRYVELKKILKNKYKTEITNFRLANDKYSEAKKYGKYHPDLLKYQHELMDRKKDLYSKEEVKEYFTLERLLNKELKEFTKKLTGTVTNKYN